MGYVNKVQIGNNAHLIEPTLYTTATKDGAAYIALIDNDFSLVSGVAVNIKFTATNDANATLNINNTGAKNIFYNNAKIIASQFQANYVYTLVYDGTQWQVVGDMPNLTYLPLAGGTMTGNIRRYYSAASTEPMITAISNNQDILLWEVGHGTAAATTTTSNHYKLLYKGTGNDGDNSNYLQLIAYRNSDVITVQIDEVGKITLPQMATGDAKTPIYINSNGVITAGNTLADLAYISKGTGSTKFLREDGTWQTALTAHRTYTAVSGKKPTGNQTPGFGSTFDIEQISQDTTGQVSVTERTVKIPDTAASATATGLVTAEAQTLGGGKTLRFTSRVYPLIGASAARSLWYKITFPYSTVTTGSSAQWFMNSFDLHFGGGYSSNPSGVAHVTFYWTRAANNGAWTVGQQAAFIEGTLANKIELYYRIAEPGILYVRNTANVYNGIWIDNLYVDDTAINLNWSTITITATEAITESTSPKLSDYTKITTSYLYNDGGTLKTDGNFEGKYIKGTWLYTSAATPKTSTAKLATIESDNFIYYITPANALKSAIGTTAIGAEKTPVYWNGNEFVAGTALKNLAYKDSLTASDIPDISGTYVKKVTSTDNAIVRFDGTSGQVQNSNIIIDDSTSPIIFVKNALVSTSTPKVGTTTNLTSSDSDLEWIKALLKQLCIEYPSKSNTIFRGSLTPNSNGYYEIYIYNTSILDEDGLPQYSNGTFRKQHTNFYIVGTSNYVPFCTAISQNGHTHNYAGSNSAGGAANSTNAANLTTTANAIAYYTNTTGTFGTKASANGVLYATSANGALNWGTLPVAQGGTGQTTLAAGIKSLLGALTEGTSDMATTDYVITRGISGSDNYYIRAVSHIVTATNVKTALGTNSSTTNQWLNKKGEWSTPTATQVGALPVNYSAPDFSAATTTNGVYPLAGTNPVTNTTEYGGVLQFGAFTSNANYYAAQLIVSSASGATSPVHAYIRRMTSTPAWSDWTTLLDNKNTTAPSTVPTLSWNTESTVFTLNGTAVKVKAMAKPTYAFTDLTSHPTTLSGYGITDAKIASGVITLGSNTITPVTKVNGHTGSSVSVTAADLGLSNAMHFIGVATVALTDGGTENPTITGYDWSKKQAGDVVIDKDTRREYVWSTTNKWEMLGFDASTAYSKTTSGNTFISKVSQATDGTVTAETRALDTSGAWTGSAAKLSNTSKVGDTDRPVYFTAGGVPSAVTYRMAATNTTATTAVAIADNLNTGIWYVNGTSSILGQSDGAVIVNKYNDNWITEMYQDYRTGQLAIRGKNNGTWQSWRKVLDAENWQTTAGIEIIRLS